MYPHKPAFFALLLFILFSTPALSQELSLDDIPEESVPVKEAFNGPSVIITQSTNTLQKGQLHLVFRHTFGKISTGAFNAFGLDQAFIRIGAEYGITDWLTAGIGRSSFGKAYDLYFKGRPLVQTTGGSKNIPVSAAVLVSSAFSSNELRRENQIRGGNQLVNQLVYTVQGSVSRQFSTAFSAQVTGSLVHKNAVPYDFYHNDIYGVGIGARLKVSGRVHLVAEYNHMFNNPVDVYNPIAAGADIVVGGHLFSVYVSNSVGLNEMQYLAATKDKVQDLRLGFTIRRMFNLKAKVEGGKVKI